MSPEELLARLLSGATSGDLPQITYAQAVAVLRHCQYDFAEEDSAGAYRSWKHRNHRDVLTVRDAHARPMYSSYIRKLARHLQKVQNAGGFNGPEDA